MEIKVLSVSDVAPHKFRTLEEVETYLKGIADQVREDEALLKRFQTIFANCQSLETAAGKITIKRDGGSKSVAPTEKIDPIFIKNLRQLKTNFDVVESLQDKLDILDTIQLQVDTLFKGVASKSNVASQLKTMRSNIEKKLNQSYDFLNKVGQKHEPELFGSITDDAIQALTGKLYASGNLADHDVFVYLTTTDDAKGKTTLVFSKYLALYGLKDDTGFVYEDYYIVFTATVTPTAEMSMSVTTLTKWLIPGKFKVGHEFNSVKNLVNNVETLLDMENFSHILESVQVPVGKGDLKLTSTAISNVVVKGDVISISLKPTKSLQAVVESVTTELLATLSTKTKMRVKYKVEKLAGGKAIIHYRLIAPESDAAKQRLITSDKLQVLKDRLGFDDDDISAIVKFVNKG